MATVPDAERQLAAPEGVARRVEELYTAHIRLVRSVCRSLLRDRNEAEDAVQQTFLSAQRALANGSSPREPAAWLAVIARNECLARVRERMREPLPVDAEQTELGGDAYSAAVSRYEVATLREALADLPRAQREAIILRELRGLSYDEVARALSVTTGAVESLIFRARRTLQVRLSEALTALSPVTLLGRLLGGEGDVTGAAAAKVAAIGVGAVLLAGGAALGPRALGLGHAAPRAHVSAQPAPVRAASTPVIPALPAPIWSKAVPGTGDTHQGEREATVAEKSDVKETERSSKETSSKETSSSEGASSDSTKPESAPTEPASPETTTAESEAGNATVSTVPTTPAAPPAQDTGGTDDSSGSGD